MSKSTIFINSLKNNDLNTLKSISKSDLHNHSTRDDNPDKFFNETDKKLISPTSFKDLDDMQVWYEANIKPFIDPIKLVELAFKQANHDNIKVLHMSFGLKNVSNIQEYLNVLKNLQQKHAPKSTFIPEIGFGRHQDIYEVEKLFDQILEYKFFKAIDLRGDETLPVKKFKNLYKKAKANDFILKAHTGEYCDPKFILRDIELLNLDQLQHGITAVHSKDIVSEIIRRDIQLNICPTSNIKLQWVKDYKSHPIKNLFDNGVKVTINTDDMLMFGSSVSEEYLKLHNAEVFSAEELDTIRLQGLSAKNSLM